MATTVPALVAALRESLPCGIEAFYCGVPSALYYVREVPKDDGGWFIESADDPCLEELLRSESEDERREVLQRHLQAIGWTAR